MADGERKNNFNTKEILTAYELRPNKALGQNFLNDMNVVEKIADSAETDPEDVVIEVGPGLGVLTSVLAKRVHKVYAVETDRKLEAPLNILKIQYPNIEIIFGDIMKTDIKKEIIDKCEGRRVKVAANLPYYITTPVVMMFLENCPYIDSMTLMVQKEVGERMVAGPGGKEYGALSVAVAFYTHPVINFTVPPHCFIPRPKVDSCVVTLKIRKEPFPGVDDKEHFFKVVKAAFGQRRKMLTNALANASYLGVTRENVKEALNEMGLSENIRGETLTCEEFARLSALLRSMQ